MSTEDEVIEANRRFQAMVSGSILGSNDWRIEEAGRRNGITDKAHDVQQGKVDSQAMGRFALPVEQGLRIERQGPR